MAEQLAFRIRLRRTDGGKTTEISYMSTRTDGGRTNNISYMFTRTDVYEDRWRFESENSDSHQF